MRERKEDIPLLAKHFLEQGARRMKCRRPELPVRHLDRLQDYEWPGNVRELRNVIERALINSRCGQFRLDLPKVTETFPLIAVGEGGRIVPEADLRRLERQNVENALEQCGWKIYGNDGAAALLGVRPTTLASRIQRMGLKKRE